jgi:hypothetical protein
MALDPGVSSISDASKHRIQRLFKGIDNKIDLIAGYGIRQPVDARFPSLPAKPVALYDNTLRSKRFFKIHSVIFSLQKDVQNL